MTIKRNAAEPLVALNIDWHGVAREAFRYFLIGLEWLVRSFAAVAIIMIPVTARVAKILAPVTSLAMGPGWTGETVVIGETVIRDVIAAMNTLHDWSLVAGMFLVVGVATNIWILIISPRPQRQEGEEE